jgi:hypothetical protein
MHKIEPEADGVLKDGQMLRVQHMMMDASKVAVADTLTQKAFDAANHMPRSGTLTEDQRNAAIERQKAYDKRVSDAWKNPPMADLSLQTGDQNPSLGHAPSSAAHVVGAVTVSDLDAIQAANERRYAAKISEAWRNPAPAQGAKS